MQAKCLTIIGRLRDARATAEAGLSLADSRPAALDGFGAIFSMLGDHGRAIDLFQGALRADPRNPQILYNLAAAERMTAGWPRRNGIATKIIALDPHYYLAYYLRADLREQSADRNHIVEMDMLIRNGLRHSQGEVLLRFALGKECEDIGDYKSAFRHIAAGASLHRRNIRYTPRHDIETIDGIIENRSRAALAQPTQVLRATIRSSSSACRDPAPAWPSASSHRTAQCAPPANWAHFRLNCAGAHERSGRFGPGLFASRAAIWLRRSGTLHRQISRQLPSLRGTSTRHCPKRGSSPCAAIRSTAALPSIRHISPATIRFSYDLKELAEYYAAFDRLMTHWKAVLPARAFLEVAYEDIVADPEGQSRKILGFLDLPWRTRFCAFTKAQTRQQQPAPSRCAGRSMPLRSASGAITNRNSNRCGRG